MIRKTIHYLLPDAEALLALEPEELAGYVLESLIWHSNSSDGASMLNRYNFTLPNNFSQYPPQHQKDVAKAVMEAWSWLEREGLVAPQPGQQHDWIFITRRGYQLQNKDGMQSYLKSNLLPKRQLHPIIAQKVWTTFLRGDYDTAVFQAFKEVEVAVRTAGNFDQNDLGVALMRKAFDEHTGNLTDKSQPQSERQALSHLFAGAIGSYKNPHSHRNVSITADEAVEMIMLASHLLRIVDARRPAT